MFTYRAKLRLAGIAVLAAALWGGWSGSNLTLTQSVLRGQAVGGAISALLVLALLFGMGHYLNVF